MADAPFNGRATLLLRHPPIKLMGRPAHLHPDACLRPAMDSLTLLRLLLVVSFDDLLLPDQTQPEYLPLPLFPLLHLAPSGSPVRHGHRPARRYQFESPAGKYIMLSSD